jgi:O-antigen ligase
MWLTWGLTVIITGVWLIKMISTRTFTIKRTPFDIPILLFLLSQLISTIFSLDSRISFWGYYSRFNGGFLSLLTYTVLYYAFVSNSTLRDAKRFIFATILGSVVVILWGLPSHFGYDPTCLLFRGSLDTACWTDAFKPTARIFSTLGQPAWLAAYLAALLPITMAMTIWEKEKEHALPLLESLRKPKIVGLWILSGLMYLALLYTDTRGGFLAFWAANGLFWAALWFIKLFPLRKLLTYFLAINLFFFFFNFTSGTPIHQLDTLSLRAFHSTPKAPSIPQESTTSTSPSAIQTTNNITDSGDIRLLVWKGALDIWKAHPLIGTGVETYAFAYYMFRPAAHNLTSEWDYLYNKAHNEYLNYLATTGALGLGTHVLFLLAFFFIAFKQLRKARSLPAKELNKENWLYTASFPGALLSIIISNFFGFSVVIMNIFLYFIPIWLLFFSDFQLTKKLEWNFSHVKKDSSSLNLYQWTGISSVGIIAAFLLIQLLRFWTADVSYALGMNLDHVGDASSYQTAFTKLQSAVNTRPNEPVFQDEFSLNMAILGSALIANNNATVGAQLANQAVTLSDTITTNHPNNVVYWKSRVRIFYLLAQVDPKYYKNALEAVLVAKKLAPTDAKISYNVGVLYGQNDQVQNGINELTRTISLKPDYRDAYFARSIFYHQLSESATGQEKIDLYNKGVMDLRYILAHLAPNDDSAKKTLTSWGEKI